MDECITGWWKLEDPKQALRDGTEVAVKPLPHGAAGKFMPQNRPTVVAALARLAGKAKGLGPMLCTTSITIFLYGHAKR